MTLTTEQICTSPIVSGPLTFDDVSGRPGVYRLKNHSSSAALVVMSDRRRLYVNDNWVENFDNVQKPPYEETQFWQTSQVVPDEIVGN
jgi:hypothetical protein